MKWQFYPSWRIGYHKLYDADYKLYLNFLNLGPLQIRWYSS